jgi:hypothetical protein
MDLICSDNFKQIFITDTHPTRLNEIFKATKVDFKVFNISKGIAQDING